MRIGHVAIYTQDIERSSEFYCKYFGGERNDGYHNKTTDFRSYFLRFEEGVSLEIMTRPEISYGDEVKGERRGIDHIAFFVLTKVEVDQLTNRIRQDGYEVLSGPRTTGDGYYESCIADPDGNKIEIVSQKKRK